MYPAELKYDKDHEWVRVEDDAVVIGITEYAQDQLGEVVYVDLPSVGDDIVAGESFGEIESVKSVSELYSPVSGSVTKVNEELDGSPENVNEDAYGAGWMIEIAVSDATPLASLMSAEDYEAFVTEEG